MSLFVNLDFHVLDFSWGGECILTFYTHIFTYQNMCSNVLVNAMDNVGKEMVDFIGPSLLLTYFLILLFFKKFHPSIFLH